MGMFVWPDGTVTGSVNVAELDAIQKASKGVSKKRLASFGPIESAAQLADLLAGGDADDGDEPEPAKAAKGASKPDADSGEALSKVDLPDLLDKAKPTTKKEKS